MISGIALFLLFILQALAFTRAFNASNLLPLTFEFESPPPSSHFLQDILKAISVKQTWNLEEIRVSDVDVRNARVGSSQMHEFRLWIAEAVLGFRFPDDIWFWKKLSKGEGQFGLDLINSVVSKPLLKPFELEGPFELRAEGDDRLSLVLLPNTTHTGLKRVLVGEGISIEVEGAREVSLVHHSNFGLPVNGSLKTNKNRMKFWPSEHSLCMPLLPIHISGSASLVAYRSHNSNSYIRTTFPSRDTVELLPEKCYSGRTYKNPAGLIHSLSLRLALLEKLLRSFLGDKTFKNGMPRLLKSKITASTIVRFQLELERDVGNNVTVETWRTKHPVERVWFEIVARVESECLKPLMVKKVSSFVGADSIAWSNLMSNVSFTQLPSILLPPEALTLDVKW